MNLIIEFSCTAIPKYVILSTCNCKKTSTLIVLEDCLLTAIRLALPGGIRWSQNFRGSGPRPPTVRRLAQHKLTVVVYFTGVEHLLAICCLLTPRLSIMNGNKMVMLLVGATGVDLKMGCVLRKIMIFCCNITV